VSGRRQIPAGEPDARCLALSRHKLSDRRDDLYETDQVAVDALLSVERLPPKIWEPACARGKIVDVLRAAGHEVIATDLVDYGDPTHIYRRDFLFEPKAPAGCEAIVTNPPYKLASEFVEHALRLCPFVVMLLRLTFIESQRRRAILESGHLARIHVFSNRLPMMHRDGWVGHKASSAVPYAWFVWDTRRRGPTVISRVTWKVS